MDLLIEVPRSKDSIEDFRKRTPFFCKSDVEKNGEKG